MKRSRSMVLRTLSVALLVAALSSSSGIADAAWSHGHGRGAGGSHLLFQLIKGVGATDAQQAQIQQVVANHRPNFQNLAGQLRSAHQALAAKLYSADPVGAQDLAPLAQQVQQLRSQLMQESLQVALEIRGVLTADQLAKVAQNYQQLTQLQAQIRSLLGRP